MVATSYVDIKPQILSILGAISGIDGQVYGHPVTSVQGAPLFVVQHVSTVREVGGLVANTCRVRMRLIVNAKDYKGATDQIEAYIPLVIAAFEATHEARTLNGAANIAEIDTIENGSLDELGVIAGTDLMYCDFFLSVTFKPARAGA